MLEIIEGKSRKDNPNSQTALDASDKTVTNKTQTT